MAHRGHDLGNSHHVMVITTLGNGKHTKLFRILPLRRCFESYLLVIQNIKLSVTFVWKINKHNINVPALHILSVRKFAGCIFPKCIL